MLAQMTRHPVTCQTVVTIRRKVSEWWNGRSDRIRTCNVLLPKQVLYQAELRSEPTNAKNQMIFSLV